jgi:transcription initiation factor TFIIB
VQSLITDPLKTSSLDSFISRFSSFLEVKPETQNNALKVANQVTKLGILDGKSPITLVAACLLFGLLTSMLFSSLALNLSTATKPPTEIAAACGCTEGTMKNAYRLLYERKEAIVEGITFSKAVEQLPVW